MSSISEPTVSHGAGATPSVSPYGSWASPISAENLAKGAIGVSELRAADGRLYWLENRPEEGGRLVAMTGDADGCRAITPVGFNVRTRVHEYGGGAFVVVGDQLFFSNFADQRLYVQSGSEPPVPLTTEGYRYADCVAGPDGGLIGVREDHSDPLDIRNAIVAIAAADGDAGRVLFGDSDFVAYPRVSPDGRRLAWMAWDHPNMPWDDTRLYVADLGPTGLSNMVLVAGGGAESVMEPRWGADGALYFISDRTGFWNLYVRRGDETRAVLTRDAEFAGPLWSLGQSNYAVLDNDRLAVTYADADGDHLAVVDGSTGTLTPIALPFNVLGAVQAVDPHTIGLVAASGIQTAAVITVDIESGAVTLVRRPSPATVEPRYISPAQSITFAGLDGRDVHALYYPPANGDFTAPAGEKPPLIVQVHGGPTSQASAAFSLANQFWTSRGFAVIDVDYGGSSGYGRAYRQRLNGQWGVTDVNDVIAAVKHLTGLGWADPDRVAIHGGSAGGFTVLGALSQSDVFKAGASFYGIADLEALARDTHKFESRYMDNLVGPYPAAKAVYQARSALNHLEGFRAPLIIFQGADDPVVPPNQAHAILDALRLRQQPVAYMEFAGEGHGFRRAENLIASKQAELYFYSRVFRFAPADTLPEVAIENLPKP